MQRIEKITQQLVDKIRRQRLCEELSNELIADLNRIVKETVKVDFRLKRTLRDKKISNAVLKNTINQLERQNEIIEKQSKFKEELFASISHELRTPLHGILGMSQLISRTELSQKQTEFVNLIRGSADNLMVIINDILSLTQMNAGKIELVEQPFSLQSVIKDIEGTLRLKAEEKNLFLRVEIDPDIPNVITGDQTRIYQILINLLNNSIKFTKKGWVLLKIEALENRGKEVDLLFKVEDTGIGIEEEKQEVIFQPFSRVHDQRGEIIEGAGLGLNIVNNLVDLLGGKINITSELGIGTCFELYLTAPVPAVQTTKTGIEVGDELEVPVAWQDLDFLLIEDNPANILYAKHLFLEWDIVLEVAEDCAASREKLRAKKYDMILSDVKLPDGNGIDLIREVRENFNSPNYQTPVIILTASASEHERIITEAINIQSYMGKPFRPTLLIKEMKKAINSDHQEEKASFSVPEKQKKCEKLIYFANLYKSFSKNPSVVKEMLSIFKAQIPVTLEKLEKSLQEENYEGFYFEIHRIKSTINIVGLPILLELAMVMERDSYNSDNVATIPENFAKFKAQAKKDIDLIEVELEKLNVKVT